MRRELTHKRLISCPFSLPLKGASEKFPHRFGPGIFRDEFAADSPELDPAERKRLPFRRTAKLHLRTCGILAVESGSSIRPMSCTPLPMRSAALRSAALNLEGLRRRAFPRSYRANAAPTLGRQDIVMLDNLTSHKAAGVAEAIAAQGAQLVYPAALRPRPQPIEQASGAHSADIGYRLVSPGSTTSRWATVARAIKSP